jgi:hypothetical protein
VGKDIAICPAFREERGTRCARRAERVIAFADGGEVDGGEPARCWRVEIWAARVGPDKPPMNRLGWIMVTTPSSFACMPRLRPRPARRSTAAVRSCHANRTGLAVEAALYRPCALRWFNSTGPYISTVPQRVSSIVGLPWSDWGLSSPPTTFSSSDINNKKKMKMTTNQEKKMKYLK